MEGGGRISSGIKSRTTQKLSLSVLNEHFERAFNEVLSSTVF